MQYKSKEVYEIEKYQSGMEDGFMYGIPSSKIWGVATLEEAQEKLRLLGQDGELPFSYSDPSYEESCANNGYYLVPFVWDTPKYAQSQKPRLMLEIWKDAYVVTDSHGRKKVIDERDLERGYEK